MKTYLNLVTREYEPANRVARVRIDSVRHVARFSCGTPLTVASAEVFSDDAELASLKTFWLGANLLPVAPGWYDARFLPPGQRSVCELTPVAL